MFSPFLEEARTRLKSRDSGLAEYLSDPTHDFAHDTDPAPIALIYISTLQPSSFDPASRAHVTSRGCALASRTDALDPASIAAVYPLTSPTLTSMLFALVFNLLAYLMWWTLELMPTLQISCDVDGKYRSHQWYINAGRGRQLTAGHPTWHWSVRERMKASADELRRSSRKLGSVQEGHARAGAAGKYSSVARFLPGQSIEDVQWDEGK